MRTLTTREILLLISLVIVGTIYIRSIYHTYDIKVLGNAMCVTQTNSMLTYIQRTSVEDYNYVRRFVGMIECGDHSGVFVWEKPPRFTAGPGVRDKSLTWYAGSLIHDACHVQQFKERKPFTGELAEKECLLIQQAALKRLKAPPEEYVSLLEVANTRYWETPYEERGW